MIKKLIFCLGILTIGAPLAISGEMNRLIYDTDGVTVKGTTGLRIDSLWWRNGDFFVTLSVSGTNNWATVNCGSYATINVLVGKDSTTTNNLTPSVVEKWYQVIERIMLTGANLDYIKLDSGSDKCTTRDVRAELKEIRYSPNT